MSADPTSSGTAGQATGSPATATPGTSSPGTGSSTASPGSGGGSRVVEAPDAALSEPGSGSRLITPPDGSVRRRSSAAGERRPEREVVLSAHALTKHFPVTRGIFFQKQVGAVRAVDGIDLEVRRGETLGLVGESGCGKSTTGRLLVRLLDATSGQIRFQGEDITRAKGAHLRQLRKDFQIVFQGPYSSLIPRYTVGAIVAAPFLLSLTTRTERDTKAKVQEVMKTVGLNPEHYNRYPHEFSGGQRQRIGIARALALRPKLIIADEPVSALDVSIQAQVMNLLDDLQNEFDLTYVFIAHDLSVVRHISDRVAVMYLGKIVEVGDRISLYEHPMHPYTHALLSAVPVPDPERETRRDRILLQGDVPSPLNPPDACRFHTRCWKAQEICRTIEPPLLELEPDHQVACHFAEERASV